ENERMSRAELVEAANACAESVERKPGNDYYPFTDDCRRYENGMLIVGPPGTIGMRGQEVQGCTEQLQTSLIGAVSSIRDRRFVAVDRERGIVFSFAFFDHRPINWTWQLGELFKIENNQISRIEAIFIRGPYGVCSGWSTYEMCRSEEIQDIRGVLRRLRANRAWEQKNWEGTMIRKALLAGFLASVATPALAQNGPPPSPWAPLQDRPTCTRNELKAATAAYVEAQRKGDISGLPLHEKVHFLENMETVERSAGLWNTALPVASALNFHDDKRCKTFTEIVVTEGASPYILGTRLYMHEGKVIRVDSIVTKPGDWLFNANAFLKYTHQED